MLWEAKHAQEEPTPLQSPPVDWIPSGHRGFGYRDPILKSAGLTPAKTLTM